MATPRPALCYTKELQILQKRKLGTSGLISLYWTISYDAWRWKTTKPEDSDAFSKVEHKHQTPVAVLIMHVITSLLYIFFNNLCRPIGKYIYLSEKALICMFSRRKAPKYSKFSVTNAGKKTVDFSYGTARASTLAPEIILPTSVPLQKFLFL